MLGIDSQEKDGDYHVYQNTGDPAKTSAAGRNTMDWVQEALRRGAGEIVLNCMNQDGVRNGYDIEQLAAIQESCDVPLVASGGAGKMRDFEDVFKKTTVSAALAASVFHNGEIDIPDLKRYLENAGVEVRL